MSNNQFKIVVLGESAVGKSSILMRYSSNQFKEFNETTIGAAFISQTQVIDANRSIKFEIWDTAGQERFRSLTPMYYRGAAGALVVFDIVNKDSFESAMRWVDELKMQNAGKTVIILVGNKSDLYANRVIQEDEAKGYADSQSLAYFEASAKTNHNIENIFKSLGVTLLQNQPVNTNQNTTNLSQNVQSNSNSSCCS